MAVAKEGPSLEVKIFDSILDFIKEYWVWIIVIILVFFAWKYDQGMVLLALVGTILLGMLAWKLWIHYIRQDFISGIDFVLLEIVPPREVLRSPKAMELFFTNALYHWSIKGGKEEWWQGAVWLWFSLEIASIDGQVHFYIRTPSRVKGLIETQMYAQYPQAQVKEVEDYTLAVDKISPESAWNGWGCEFKLTKHQAYPIKTYVDFGLDKDPKEEFKVDPISPVIEFFGSLKRGEQAWIQIVITPKPGPDNVPHSWVEESKKEIFKLLKPFTAEKDEGKRIEIRTPDIYKNAVTAMNAKTGKLGFETGVRMMYIGKKEVYDLSNRRNMRLLFRQYAKPDCNEFYRCNSAQADFYGGVLLASPETVMILADRMLHEYRERAFFHLPLRHHIFSQNHWQWPIPGVLTSDAWIKAYAHHHTYVLNVEELATIWHFPGQILKVPTLERIESKEASPPTNLPI